MSRPLRILFVGRHFWPHGSIDSAGFLIQLVTGMHRSGIQSRVLTTRFSNRWPDRFGFRELHVDRPITAPRNEWGIGRYLRSWTQWVVENARGFDAIYCESARLESMATIDAAKEIEVPVVVRIAGTGDQSDIEWWAQNRMGRRVSQAVQSADRILVSAPSLHRRLIASGFDSQRVSRLEIGSVACLPARVPQGGKLQERARFSLAAINSDLFVPPDGSVLMAIGPMDDSSDDQSYVVKKCMQLINRIPGLHIWLIGDGPRRDAIVRRLRSDGVRGSVAIPGSFGNIEDLYAAADIFLQAGDGGTDYFLPTAVASGVPIVAARSPALGEFFERGTQAADSAIEGVTWFNRDENKGLRGAVEAVTGDPESARRSADLLRSRMQRERSLDLTVQQLRTILTDLVRSHRGAKDSKESQHAASTDQDSSSDAASSRGAS